jgi:peptidyl-prolyl cis-trans isomerase D
MFDWVHKNKRIAQVILGIIFLPFAFVGVDSYFRDSDNTTAIATVGRQTITEQEFNVSLRERQEQIQSMTGGRMDSAMLDNPDIRKGVVDSLVNQRLMQQVADAAKLVSTDDQLRALLEQASIFQEQGKFSQTLYADYLKNRNKGKLEFENELRGDLILRQVDDPFVESNFAPQTVTDRLYKSMESRREVSIFTLPSSRFESKVTLDSEAAKKYYESRKEEFRVPEQVRVSYVNLSMQTLLPSIQVSEEAIKKSYDEYVSKNQVQETRQASHILIDVAPKASAEEKQKAKAKAQALFVELKAHPENFKNLAKTESKDPGSASKGGELDAFKKADMVKPFSDAAFAMKEGDITGPVETEYGFHIIKLNKINAGKQPSFESMHTQITEQLKKLQAQKKFAELAEQFNNTLFEQFDNLKAAAEVSKSNVEQSDWFSRGTADKEPRLNNPKLLTSIFSDEVLKNKRNSEAVEISPGNLVAARLLETKPSIIRPFDEVKNQIARILIERQSQEMAEKEGKVMLEQLNQGNTVSVQWGAGQVVGYSASSKDINDALRRQILSADTTKVPTYLGLKAANGYTVVRISKILEAEKVDDTKKKNMIAGLVQSTGQEQFSRYLTVLKEKSNVKIHTELFMNKKEIAK